MSSKKPFEPNFKTPPEAFCKEEINKLNSNGLRDNLHQEFRNDQPDISWEAEQLAKSHGIYLEFNRAKKDPKNKEWIYMIRVTVPGGGPINREQWRTFDELSKKYTADPQGHTSLRFTTRQNIQFHWIKKAAVLDVIKSLAEKGMNSLNGCGDNTRNVMGCPLSCFSDIFNANEWAHRVGDYFQLPLDPFIEIFEIDPNYVRRPGESFQYGPNILNRKFKISFSSVYRDPKTGKIIPDNCVEVLTNDIAIVPIVKKDKVTHFQIYIGGGQGERNEKASMATLAKPFAIVTEVQLLPTLDAIVHIHQEWGDRQNRVWARLKYLVKKMGIEWYRDQVTARLGFPLGKPNHDHDYGDRHLHLGWHEQPSNGLLTYGAFIENGRITDASPNGKLQSMVRDLMEKYPIQLMITPNQDILFTNIPSNSKTAFEADMKNYGYGLRNGKIYSNLRLHSGACVGRDTCRLTYTDSEKFEPVLIDQLEKMGWGDLRESIGITGCERQCFRPATKTIGLVGSGLNRYQLKLFGDETARYQGTPLTSTDGEKIYLRSIPREHVATVIDALFKFYKQSSKNGESLGAFNRRMGPDKIIQYLKDIPATASLVEKIFGTECVIE